MAIFVRIEFASKAKHILKNIILTGKTTCIVSIKLIIWLHMRWCIIRVSSANRLFSQVN